jgi:hypothetical protein
MPVAAPAPAPIAAPTPVAAIAPSDALMPPPSRAALAPPVAGAAPPVSPPSGPVADWASPPAPSSEVSTRVVLANAVLARPMLRDGVDAATDAVIDAAADEPGGDESNPPSTPDAIPGAEAVADASARAGAAAPYRPDRRPPEAAARFASLPAALPDFGGRPTPRPIALRLAGPRSSGGRGGGAATFQSALVVSGPILLGVTTRNGDRLALIRNGEGAVRRVAVGQAVDGWTVAAIHDDRVQLRSARGRETLRVPRP